MANSTSSTTAGRCTRSVNSCVAAIGHSIPGCSPANASLLFSSGRTRALCAMAHECDGLFRGDYVRQSTEESRPAADDAHIGSAMLATWDRTAACRLQPVHGGSAGQCSGNDQDRQKIESRKQSSRIQSRLPVADVGNARAPRRTGHGMRRYGWRSFRAVGAGGVFDCSTRLARDTDGRVARPGYLGSGLLLCSR